MTSSVATYDSYRGLISGLDIYKVSTCIFQRSLGPRGFFIPCDKTQTPNYEPISHCSGRNCTLKMTAMSTIPLLLLFALSLGQADEIHGPFALSFEDPFHGSQWQVWLRPNFGDVIRSRLVVDMDLTLY